MCESGWTARDLSDSLRVRTAVLVHLFYLVVEGRVLGCDELVRNLARIELSPCEGEFLVAHGTFRQCGQGAGRRKARAFDAVRHVPMPFCPLDQCRTTLVRLGRRVNRGI